MRTTLALLSGILATGCHDVATAKTPADLRDAVVAVRDLVPGTPIGPSDVVVRGFPPEAVPATGTLPALMDVLGLAPTQLVLANEMVRKERLASGEAAPGLNSVTAIGSRALTLEFTTASGWTSLLRPGDRVDLYWTELAPPEPGVPSFASNVVAQDLTLLAVSTELGTWKGKTRGGDSLSQGYSDPPPRDAGTLTLEVTPGELEILAEAKSTGTLHVALRSDIDVRLRDSATATTIGTLTAPVVP